MKKVIQSCLIFLALIGALNWGLIGGFDLNLVTLIFYNDPFTIHLVYILISCASFYVLFYPSLSGNYCYRLRKRYLNHDVANKQMIAPSSPSIIEQENFINEGGNSQPLSKDDM